jgi:hypothetical protein
MRTVLGHANWRHVKVSVILELRVFALVRGDEMSGRIFAPFPSKSIMVLPAALFAAMTVCPAATPNGQSQDQQSSGSQAQSIADAARRSRETAKNVTKPSKVITDDDLDKGNIKPGAQGLTVDAPAKLETQPPSPEAVADAAATPSAAPDPATVAAASDDPAIAKLKESIADSERDAELARRDLALQQDTLFSNPDYEHDIAGKAKLDVLQQQINDKQQEIDRMKTRLAALEELQKKKQSPAKPVAAPAPSDQSSNPNAVPPASPKP